MNKKYACYCGLYCGNCPVKAKIEPAAKVLFQELKNANFEGVIPQIPGGDGFWLFLKSMVESGICVSCQKGSGNPACAVRVCAQEKGVKMCALCSEYPCDKFTAFFKSYPLLKQDNALLRDKGWDAWAELQDKRLAEGFTYADAKKKG